MKKLIPFLILIILPSALNAQNNEYDSKFHLIPRAGFSDISGIIGFELKQDRFGLNIGWFGTFSTRLIVPSQSRTLYTVGATFDIKKKNNTPYVAISQVINGSTLENRNPDWVTWHDDLAIIGGYRFRVGSFGDVRLGAGPYFLQKEMTIALDASVGILLFNRKK